jgi:hypothetical protein
MERHLYDAPDARTAPSDDGDGNGDEIYEEPFEESSYTTTGEEVY